jgi:hypothetical protein
MHGGGPKVAPGKALDKAYTEKNVGWWRRAWRTSWPTSRRSSFPASSRWSASTTSTRTPMTRSRPSARRRRRPARAWPSPSTGKRAAKARRELAETVVEACNQPSKFKFLYELSTPLSERIRLIATKVYGADGVSYTPLAQEKLKAIEADPELSKLGTCMVKTHLSLSHDPTIKGRPRAGRCPSATSCSTAGAGIHRARGGRHQAHAGHCVGARLPQHRRGRGDGQGEGAVLSSVAIDFCRRVRQPSAGGVPCRKHSSIK